MTFLSNDQAIFSLVQEYPDLVHGRDFWIAQPVKENSAEYTGDAFIVEWLADGIDQPTAEDLADLVAKYQTSWDASAHDRMPDLTARQLRLGLLSLGKLSDVPTAIAALSSPEREQAEIEWQFASQFRRLHPLIVQLIPILGLTDEQVDAVWLEYAQV